VDIANVDSSSPLLEQAYEELLRPSFTRDELVLLPELRELLRAGAGVVTVTTDGEGTPDGVAVGEWSPDTGVLLLAYLAVRAGRRSAGLGSRLLERVRGDWRETFRPRLTLAEIEHPTAHPADDRGDPHARLRFYHRHDSRALAVPYVQPALRPGARRVPGMLLITLDTPVPDAVPAAPVRAYLREYFEDAEGADATGDPALRPLWRAVDDRETIALLSLAAPERLPLSALG
jgi:GNAT superfamily N-acetyltransferase